MQPATAQAITASIRFMCAPPFGAHSSRNGACSAALPASPGVDEAAVLFEERLVVAGKVLQPSVVEGEDAVRRRVDQMPVVRDEDRRAGIVRQAFSERGARLEIEVARRLVA